MLVLFAAHWISTAWTNATMQIKRKEMGWKNTSETEQTITEKLKDGDGMGVSTDIAKKSINFLRGSVTGIVIILIIVGIIFPPLWLIAGIIVALKFLVKEDGL